jgi:nitrogen fixation/metabolism regulation signal transduction histidine kinase
LQKSENEFRDQLARTESMISEELAQLKNTVNRFSEFARLPQVVVTEQNMTEILQQHTKALANTIEEANIEFRSTAVDARVRVDATLLRQVLANIIRNGIEANPNQHVRFDIELSASQEQVRLTVSNDGVPVPLELAPRIFDPYVSSKTGKNNMGLGLAIVRKIMIEHGGDIVYLENSGRPTFVISIPRVA